MSLTADHVLDLQTQAFIDMNPLTLVLTRPVLIPDGAGGQKKGADLSIGPQTVTLIGISTPRPAVTPDGRNILVNQAIVGMPGLDIAVDDTFVVDGISYLVVGISRRTPWWRVIAEVESRGPIV